MSRDRPAFVPLRVRGLGTGEEVETVEPLDGESSSGAEKAGEDCEGG